jgi:hypothetical protein
VAGGSREIVELYARAMSVFDKDAIEGLLHDDFVDEYPQSGERIVGKANLAAMVEHYPGFDREPLHGQLKPVLGRDDSWAVGPSYNVVHVMGSGDEFGIAGVLHYPNNETWHVVQFVRVRAGKIWRVVSYFGQPFDPPEWRRPYVERRESTEA